MQILSVPKPPSIRDFAYEPDQPLHYGVQNVHRQSFDEALHSDGNNLPWEQTEDTPQDIIPNEEFEVGHRSDSNIQGKAIALFDFVPENDNEFALKEGQIIWINYRHGQGWLVAAGYDEISDGSGVINSEYSGLVPEEYVQLLDH